MFLHREVLLRWVRGVIQPRRSTRARWVEENCGGFPGFAVAWLAIWLCAGMVCPAASLPNYFTRFWPTEKGVPENNVTSVVQTRDSYVWLGTRNGLARFDGVRFTVFNDTPEMRSRHVTALFEGKDGTLWIGHETGEVTSYKDGKFAAVPVLASWRGGKIFAIAADTTGEIWLVNQNGDLARINDGLVLASPSETKTHLVSVTRLPNGGFWVQRDQDVSRLENGKLKPLVFDEYSTNRYVQGICACRDGGLWVAQDNRVSKWKGEQRVENIEPAPWGWSPAHTLIETRDGLLVAATADHGIFLVLPGGRSMQFCRTNGFTSDWVTSLCEDLEGNLWAGTGNGGLAMLRTVNNTTLTPPDHWQGRAVLSVAAAPDNSMWVGTEGAGLYRFGEGTWTNLFDTNGLSHRYVWSVTFDTQGRPWAGTWGSGVFARETAQFQRPAGLEDIDVAALWPTCKGGMLVGSSSGLLRYESGKATWLTCKPQFVSPDVRAVQEAPDGTIWFGTSGGGLGSWKDGKLRQIRRGDGLSSEFVQCLHLENDGTLWAGTFGGGLNRLRDGRIATVTRDQGLPNDVICNIQDDGLGFFWISSHGGIFRVGKEELNRCADAPTNKLHCLSYGLSDGLPTLECSGGSQPAGCRTPDGFLWFATAKGLVGIDPTNVKTNRLKPPVVIEEVRVDGRALTNSGAAGRVRIPPGRHRLDFEYTALSFVAPERVFFKHRLAGLETDWLNAEAKRLVNYNYIPPGDYMFRVIACNNDGVWNDEGAAFAFTVLPYFWQTWWFRIATSLAAAAAVGGSVLLATRRRIRHKLEELKRQRAIERERTRIAKDIHDELGASLTRISLLSQSARSSLSKESPTAAELDRIYGTARELTRAMDEIVWAVNPQHDTLDSLAIYLGKFAQDFLRPAGIRCRLNVPEQLPPWPVTAEVRHNLFLAFKEALNNVVKHAGASAVLVTLHLNPAGFAIVIEDNGRGFRPDSVPSSDSPELDRIEHGNGLANMRLRLEEIGGVCDIQSTLEAGTKVKLEVNIKLPGIAPGRGGGS